MKKFFKSLLLILLLVPLTLMFTACSSKQIVDIKKTSSSNGVDIYTIYYSDGTLSSMTIENGKDADPIDIEAVYQLGVTKGYYTDDLEGYLKFLTDLMNKEQNTTSSLVGVNKAMQSAVSVYAKFPINADNYPYRKSTVICGAGVIYKMEQEYSYIVTNYHVLYCSSTSSESKLATEAYVYQYGSDVEISLDSNKDYQISGNPTLCEYIGGSMQYDIGVLRVKTADLIAKNATATAVKIASGYKVGEKATAIGNPEGEGISVSSGVVSVESETVTITGVDNVTDVNFRVLRIDTAINGGNSGGGLFNENGELIGIVNAKLVYSSSDNTPIDGMCYALPIDNITKVADNIIYYYNIKNEFTPVYRLYLGINYQTKNSKQVYNPLTGEMHIEDQLVVAKAPDINSLAYSFGIQKDDVITELRINDKTYKLTRSFYMSDLLLTVRTDDTISLSYTRDGLDGTQHTGDYKVLSSDLSSVS